MLGLKSKKSTEPTYTHAIVYRAPGVRGFVMGATGQQAHEAFAACVRQGHIDPHNGRQLTVMLVDEWRKIAAQFPDMAVELQAGAAQAEALVGGVR